MGYHWYSKTEIQQKDNQYVFINPQKGTWLKAGHKAKEWVDNLVSGSIQSHIPEDVQGKILRQFVGAGILIPDEQGESAPPQIKKDINSLYFVTTKQCNLSCEFCSMNADPGVQETAKLSFEEIKAVIDDLSQYRIGGIIITGGEPFMRPDLPEIIDYLHSRLKTKLFLSSNGLLLTPQLAHRIAGKIARVDISLENIYPKSGRQDRGRIVEVIEMLKTQGIQVGFSYVMTRENQEYIFDYVDMAVAYDAALSIKIVAPLGKAKTQEHLFMTDKEIVSIYRRLFDYIYNKKYDQPSIQSYIRLQLLPACSCSAKESILSLCPDGSVYSCHSLCHPEFYLGNIAEQGVSGILQEKAKRSQSPYYQACFDIDERVECRTCEVRYFCRGACFAEQYEMPERQGKLPPECTVKKALLLFNLWDYDPQADFLDNLKKLIQRMEAE